MGSALVVHPTARVVSLLVTAKCRGGDGWNAECRTFEEEQLCGERDDVLRARKRSSERMAMAFTRSTETVEIGR